MIPYRFLPISSEKGELFFETPGKYFGIYEFEFYTPGSEASKRLPNSRTGKIIKKFPA